MFQAQFSITAKTARALMAIEKDRQAVELLPLSVPMLESLRRSARLLSTHYSTRIEGNRLTPAQVELVIEAAGEFPGRERDADEVRHYFEAQQYIEQAGREPGPLTEKEARIVHSLVMTGRRRATPYRDGQNVIRDSLTGRMVYMPPESKDVPRLMTELLRWIRAALAAGELPVPVVAALFHYQFATIHPYFDGNGRTARLLTTLLLHRNGYALHGIYSLEEYYAANLEGYYAGLSVGVSHNYYFGRVEADVSSFVEYFCVGMAESFAAVRAHAEQARGARPVDQNLLLRQLTPQQRLVLGLFLRTNVVTSREIAACLRITNRRGAALCARWVKAGVLAIENPSTKGRSYRLAPPYESLVEAKISQKANVTESIPAHGKVPRGGSRKPK